MGGALVAVAARCHPPALPAGRCCVACLERPLLLALYPPPSTSCRGLSVEEARRLARENAKDIIACGFDAARTFIFSDFEFVGGAFYRNIARIQR